MNFQFYLEKLYGSEEFADFKKEFADAYLCSGFFVLDKEKKEGNKAHIDFYVPSFNKMFSFQLEKGVEKVPVEKFQENPARLNDNLDFDFEKIEAMILEKMASENVTSKIQTILLSLQNLEGKEFLVGTIFISALGMIKIGIDLSKMELVDFEKKSFMDMFRIVKKEDNKK